MGLALIILGGWTVLAIVVLLIYCIGYQKGLDHALANFKELLGKYDMLPKEE